MGKLKKFLFSICFIVLIMLIFYSNLMESNVKATFIDKAQNLTNQRGADGFDPQKIANALKPVGQILTYLGAGVLVVATAYLGVQYIISPPDKQAALKEKLIGLVVAGVVIFGAHNIWASVVNMFKDL